MIIESVPLIDKEQTARALKKMIKNFSGDLDSITIFDNGEYIPAARLPLLKWFDVVRKLPYKKDIEPIEIVARPAIGYFLPGIDCKKKSVLIAGYLENKKIDWRLIVSSKRPDQVYTHVFPQAWISGEWFNLDATYSHYYPGMKKEVTAWQVLK